MNVAQLIEQLQHMPQDAKVHFEYGYGDHWRTQVAPAISSVEMGLVQYSDYHRMDKVVEPDWDNEDADEVEGRQVVLIG
jgi:hypothetical protein